MSYTHDLGPLMEKSKTQRWVMCTQDRLWHYHWNSSQHSPISAVLTVGKTTDSNSVGAGLAKKASQALQKCTVSEKEFTPRGEIIYGIARLKRRFLQTCWYVLLCSTVWTYGVTGPVKLLNVPEDLESLENMLWVGLPHTHYAFSTSVTSDWILEKNRH